MDIEDLIEVSRIDCDCNVEIITFTCITHFIFPKYILSEKLENDIEDSETNTKYHETKKCRENL